MYTLPSMSSRFEVVKCQIALLIKINTAIVVEVLLLPTAYKVAAGGKKLLLANFIKFSASLCCTLHHTMLCSY